MTLCPPISTGIIRVRLRSTHLPPHKTMGTNTDLNSSRAPRSFTPLLFHSYTPISLETPYQMPANQGRPNIVLSTAQWTASEQTYTITGDPGEHYAPYMQDGSEVEMQLDLGQLRARTGIVNAWKGTRFQISRYFYNGVEVPKYTKWEIIRSD